LRKCWSASSAPFGLEHQRQCRVGVGIGLSSSRPSSAAPWPARSCPAANSPAQLHIGPRAHPALAGLHRVVIRPTRSQPAGKPSTAQRAGTWRSSLSGSRRFLHIVVGAQLAHGDITFAATGAVQHLPYQLTTGGVDVFTTGGADSDVETGRGAADPGSGEWRCCSAARSPNAGTG
jgi:hypothetical protein